AGAAGGTGAPPGVPPARPAVCRDPRPDRGDERRHDRAHVPAALPAAARGLRRHRPGDQERGSVAVRALAGVPVARLAPDMAVAARVRGIPRARARRVASTLGGRAPDGARTFYDASLT